MKCESCKKKNDCIGYGKTPVCGAYVSEKNPTHGDKIRSMSDEELAVAIMCPAEYDLNFDKKKSCGGEMNNNCRKCCFEWLQSEAEMVESEEA